MLGGFHASDGQSVLMAPPTQIMLLDKKPPIHNEMPYLLVYCYFSRINTLSIHQCNYRSPEFPRWRTGTCSLCVDSVALCCCSGPRSMTRPTHTRPALNSRRSGRQERASVGER